MNPTPLASTYDVVIIGARVAGASTAMLLARQGLRVLVVDRSQRGTDTTSTHALMRPAVHLLASWGVLGELRRLGTPAVDTTVFHYGDTTVPIDIEPSGEVDALYAPRRTVLDQVLVDAAEEAGADVRFGYSLQEVRTGRDGRACGVRLRRLHDGAGVEIATTLVVGADGLRSPVAQQVGAPVEYRGRFASATVYAYFEGLPHDSYHWYWGPGVAAGTIPTNDGVSCVFVCVPDHRFRDRIRHDIAGQFRQVLWEAAPEVAEVIGAQSPRIPFRGHPGHVTFLRRAHGPGWALVGDAGYFKDPLSAHGITDALRDAQLLAVEVAHRGLSDLSGYQDRRDAVARPFLPEIEDLASYAWNLEELPLIHRSLARCMRHEYEMLERLTSRSAPSPNPSHTPVFAPAALGA